MISTLPFSFGVTVGACGFTLTITSVVSVEPSSYVIVTGIVCLLSGVTVGNGDVFSTTLIIFAAVKSFVSVPSTTPVTPVVPDKSPLDSGESASFTISTLVTVWDWGVYVASSESTAEPFVPFVALAVTLLPTNSLGISNEPLWNTTPSFGVSSSHPVSFFTNVTVPSVNGIVTLSPPLFVDGVTLTFPFCHCEIVGIAGFCSFTTTCTVTWFPSFPWLSTGWSVTAYTPAVGFAGRPEITLTFPAPNGLSVVLSSSVSVTVTNSFSKSSVSVVPAV